MQPQNLIHPTAIIDPGAQIGKGTLIWHFCHIMPLASVGDGCTIGQNVFIDNHVEVGNRVKIQNNVSLYNGVIIGDDVFLGPSVVFTNVINPRSFIERKNEFKPTLISNGATIGANAAIICGISIGAYALVGAGAVVTKSFPPFALVTGNPATQKGWVSRSAYKLIFNDKGEGDCPATREKYRLNGTKVEILE
ncbi:MAG: N-acetyltransferase [Flavisolibacter sp.]|nr:N-acetyltransferase [Flavisolibacter sp.]